MIALKEDKIANFKKIFYLAKQVQKQYEQTLVEAREGTPLNSKTFWDSEKNTYLSLLLT